jgi:hypothetical protein
MPTLSGPEYLNGQFSVAADGTVSLTTPPFSSAGGTISPGPVVIRNTASAPQPPPANTMLQLAAIEGGSSGLLVDSYAINGGVALRRANGTAAAPTVVGQDQSLGTVGWIGYGTSAYSGIRAQINAAATQPWTNTAQGTYLAFSTTPAGAVAMAEVVRIDNAGNVGIGTTTPGAKLHVGASATSGGQEGLGCTVLLTAPNDGNNPLILQRSGVVNPQMLNFSLNHASHWSEIQAAQSNVGFMNLLLNRQGGFVGIGTATPHMPLSVKGGMQLADAGGMSFNSYYSSGWFYETAAAAAAISSQAVGLVFYVSPTGAAGAAAPQASAMCISPGVGLALGGFAAVNTPPAGGIICPGIVGIGTPGPTAQFQVANNTAGQWTGVLQATQAAGTSMGLTIKAGTNASDFNLVCQNAAQSTNYMIVRGDGPTQNISGAWTTISDASTKQDVQPYTRGLDAIVKLNPIMFRYVKGTPFAEADKPSRLLFGLIADEVKPHVPEVVGTTTATIGKKENVELSTLEPGNLIYALINAVKELNDQGKEMRAKVAALESATVH